MKKLLASLLVLAMCAPAMALTFSTSASGDTLTINYILAAGEGLRGLALTVTNVSGDGQAIGTDGNYSVTPFNTFIDFAADVDNAASYTLGTGHPFALITPDVAAGQYEATLPAASFALSMGYLDENGVEPGQEAITTSGAITVKFAGTTATEVAIALDTLRGGAVGDALVVDASGLVNQTLVFAPPVPACWNYNCFGYGDANGDCAITFADLQVLLGAWTPKPYAACADFTKDGAITFADLQALLNHWAPKPGCETTCVPQ